MSEDLLYLEKIELNNYGRISSVDLVEIINYFRAIERESGLTGRLQNQLQHKDLLKKIRKELEVLESVGLRDGGEFTLVEYVDKKGEKRPCYSLNKDGMLMMLNGESTLVRYKTVEYINKLENKLNKYEKPSYTIEDSIERAKAWIKEEEQRRLLDKENEKLKIENNKKNQIIGELKPKADYTDIILKSKSLVTITQIAKDYGMSAKQMNNKLHDLKVQYKLSNQWLLYSKYHNSGYTHSETIQIVHSDGTIGTKMNTKWTQKGRLFLYNLLKDNGILPVIER